MNLKRIFWPWGIIRSLEKEVNFLEGEIIDLNQNLKWADQDFDTVVEQRDVYAAMLLNASRDFGISAVALGDISDLVDAVNVPNGTTKKIGRLASTAIEQCKAKLSVEDRERVRLALQAEAELAGAETAAEAEAA